MGNGGREKAEDGKRGMATVGSSSIHVAHRRTSSSAHDLRLAKCIGECLRGPTIPSLLMESDVPPCRPRFPHRTPPPPSSPVRAGSDSLEPPGGGMAGHHFDLISTAEDSNGGIDTSGGKGAGGRVSNPVPPPVDNSREGRRTRRQFPDHSTTNRADSSHRVTGPRTLIEIFNPPVHSSPGAHPPTAFQHVAGRQLRI